MIPYFCRNYKLIDILNTNVYLSNILLLPSIVFIYQIILNINNWNIDLYKCKYFYKGFWIFVLFVFVLAFIMSCIYHINMYTKNSMLKKIGSWDHKLTAPLLTITVLILTVIYSQTDILLTNSKLYLVFIISLIFNLVGLSIYFTRRYLFLPNIINKRDTILYLINHIFFHYITYTGILLIIILFYLDYEYIYKSIYIYSNKN